MAAGIAFIVLFVVGVFTSFGNSPNIKKHDSDAVAAAKYVKQLSDSGHRAGIVIGAYLIVLAAIALVWFAQGLRTLVSSEAAGRLVAGLGVLAAAGMAVGAIGNATTAGSISFGDEPVPQNGDAIRTLMDLFFPMLFVIGGLSLAALIATIAVRARGVLPNWLLYVAWLGVLGGIVAVIFTPMVLPLLWLLIVAITLLARPERASATAAL
jgi:hypothetical protein